MFGLRLTLLLSLVMMYQVAIVVKSQPCLDEGENCAQRPQMCCGAPCVREDPTDTLGIWWVCDYPKGNASTFWNDVEKDKPPMVQING